MINNKFIIAILILALLGSLFFPVLGVYSHEVRATLDIAAHGITAILAIALLKGFYSSQK